MKSSLSVIYSSYGGWKALAASRYFHVAIIVSLLSWRIASNDGWMSLAISILPTLVGFSIAAYAVIFAVLNERDRHLLSSPSSDLGGRSPLLVVVSSITHAVIVQIIALIMAIVYSAKPFPIIDQYASAARWINYVVSGIGLLFTAYGILLVVASAVSLFKVLEIKSRI